MEKTFELNKLISIVPAMVCIANTDGYFKYLNPEWEKVLGYSTEELLSRPLYDFIHPDDLEPTQKEIERKLSGRHTLYFENQYRCKDGSYKILKWRATPADGDMLYAVAEDITERKLAEDKLRKSEERFSSIFNETGEIIFLLDVEKDGEYRFATVNPAFLATTGLTAESVVGKNVKDVIPAPSLDLVLSKYRQAIQQKTTIRWEETSEYPTGKHTALVTVAPILDADGICQNLVGNVNDITKRKKAEAALRESEEKFRTLVEESPLGISLIGKNGNYKYINPQFSKIFGYTIEDIPTGAVWFKKSFPGKIYRQNVIQTWIEDQKRIKVGQVRPRIFTVTCKDGSRKEIYFRVVTMENLDQFVIYEDITEKSKLEHQLLQAQKFEAIGTLAGGIAHDFNNLLMGIQGRSSLMLVDLDPSHPHKEHINAIEEYIRSATGLTKQLLGFAREGKYVVKPININELVSSSATMFGRTRKELNIHTKMLQKPVIVEADRSQIEQVLLNMYVNAWQAMPDDGEIYLETKFVMLDEDYCKPYGVKSGRFAKVSVTDTGIGMNEATRQRVFDPFFTTKDMSRGTGLGLASAYGIIKNHGGLITVYSEPGYGTTFNIYLPVSDKDVYQEVIQKHEMVEGMETILLVDDEDMIIEVGQAMLEKLGYCVIVSRNGLDAVREVTAYGNEIDLVILDLIMPGLDGGKTFGRIREIQPDLPVILSSGYAINGKATKIMQKGCNGFIQKPFSISEISQKIRKILDEAKGSAQQ